MKKKIRRQRERRRRKRQRKVAARRRKERRAREAEVVMMRETKRSKSDPPRWLENSTNFIRNITATGPIGMRQVIRSKLMTGHS